MAKEKAPAPKLKSLLVRVLVGVIAGAAIMTVVGVILPKSYSSSATLLFPGGSRSESAPGGRQPSGAPGGPGGGTADQPSLPLMQGVLWVPQPGTSPSTAGLILRSRKVTVDLIERFGLHAEWRLPMEQAIERFHERFRCQEGGSGDLRIVYTDRTPQRSQETIVTAVELLTQSVEELSLDPAARNVAFLRDSLRKAEAASADIQDEIVRLQRTVGGTPPDMQITTLGQLQGQLQRELGTAEVDAAVAASSMKVASETSRKIIRAAQDPTGAEGTLLSTLYRNVVDRETELAILRDKFTDRRPEVVQASHALKVARQKLETEVARQVESIDSGASPLVKDALLSVMASEARVDGLRKSSSEVGRRLSALPAIQARYNQLTQDLRDERARVTLLRSEYLRALLIAQTRGPQFVMLDPPTLPKRPDGYDLIYFTLFGAVLGGIGICMGAIVAWIRRSVRELGV